jgi:hypothetical protein
VKALSERLSNLLGLCCLAVLFPGCAHPIAGIMHPGAKRVILVYSDSQGYPSVLLGVDEQARTFRYLSMDPREWQYQIRTFDFNGRLVSQTPFPTFSAYYLGRPYCPQGFAISPDCMSVAYLDLQENNQYDHSTKDLVCFDVRTGARKLLVKDLARIWNSIQLLCWVSNTELLVAVDEYEQGEARLLLVNVEKPEVVFELHPRHPYSPQFSLSHSRRYLVYRDCLPVSPMRGALRIFDLVERREVAAIGPGSLSVHARPRWDPGDNELVYVMEDKLMRFFLGSAKLQVLKVFEPRSDILLHGWQGDRVYYTVWGSASERSPIKVRRLDLATQQETEFPNHPEGPFNVFIGRDETLIYYHVGCEPF